MFAFAGLWEEGRSKDGGEVLSSCTILTTSANELVGRLHERMPVILREAAYDDWLDLEAGADVVGLWAPFPSAEMEMFEVSPRVNDARNDGPACVEPKASGPGLP